MKNLHQFDQYYDEFIKELFWNNFLNLLKRYSCNMNTDLITVKINALLNYSPSCAITSNTEKTLVIFTD